MNKGTRMHRVTIEHRFPHPSSKGIGTDSAIGKKDAWQHAHCRRLPTTPAVSGGRVGGACA